MQSAVFKDGMHLHVTHLRKCPYRLPLPVACSAVQLAEAPKTGLQLRLGRRRIEPNPERRLALLNPQHPRVEADRDPGAALLCTLPLPFAALGPADDKTISLTQPSIGHDRDVWRQGGYLGLGSGGT